ncbi:MAG: hypothetical protein M2R45_04955 [Verrucomicrobia subdivision 3 bacterium]|nr:hypothetical protein [Limisphaerales bacterium]MCS1415608.1 hypothetical protein [Limisphaerales bacterium]
MDGVVELLGHVVISVSVGIIDHGRFEGFELGAFLFVIQGVLVGIQDRCAVQNDFYFFNFAAVSEAHVGYGHCPGACRRFKEVMG